MPMLAEKKQKVNWVLTPRESAWSKDENKFGQKLLEKMGWTPGTGLGAQRQGKTDIVKIPFKSDFKGLGCKSNDASVQQLDFDKLLEELGNHSEDIHPSIVPASLEEKSRKSRARVHYHKFIRGKDVSKYSANDLKCITSVTIDKKQRTEKGNIFTSDTNMYSYFKDKASNSIKSETNAGKTALYDDNNFETEECPELNQQLSPSNNDLGSFENPVRNRSKSVSFSEHNTIHYVDKYISQKNEDKERKLKKKIKKSEIDSQIKSDEMDVDSSSEIYQKKKKKKEKKLAEDVGLTINSEEISTSTEKINKNKIQPIVELETYENTGVDLHKVKNKKKRKKHTEIDKSSFSNLVADDVPEHFEIKVETVNNKKQRKRSSSCQEESTLVEESITVLKQKENCETSLALEDNISNEYLMFSEENRKIKRRKKKKNSSS